MEIKYFKYTKKTRRFNKNQKVWIVEEYSNHMDIAFKWRGSGRWVKGVIDRFTKCVGEIKTIEIKDSFANFIAQKRRGKR